MKMLCAYSIFTEKSYTHIQNNREFFLREETTRRVNETLRPPRPVQGRKMS